MTRAMSGAAPAVALVTGGAGFIGSQLVRELLARGASVIAADNLVNGKRANLDAAALEADGADPARLRFEEADIRDGARMAALMAGADVVFHLACLGVRHSIHAPRENHDVNATATLDLLAAARAAGVARFVYVSSSEVYGTARTAPMTEAHPTFPMTVYGAGKLAGECYARAYWETYGYPTVVIRPFNAFGPRCHHEGDSGEVIPKFMLRAMAGRPLIVFGDGTQTRDFTFVADTARGIADAGVADEAVGRTLNIGTGREIAISDLAQSVAAAVGVDVAVRHDDPRPGDVLRLIADVSEARDALGFEARTSLEDGLRALRAWYAASGQSAEQLLEAERVHNWTAEASAGQER